MAKKTTTPLPKYKTTETLWTPHVKSLLALLKQAKTSKHPALVLYQKGARNTLFKLEAICRLQYGITKNKKYDKWKVRFKLLEDAIGKIDFFDASIKQLSKAAKASLNITIAEQQLADHLTVLDDIVIAKKWVNNDLEKFTKLLSKTAVPINATYVQEISAYFTKSVASTVLFLNSLNGKLSLIEEHVHELRRKLRWLSIYVQCYPGVFYYYKDAKMPAWAKPYCTKAIINSPFNALAAKSRNTAHIALNYYSFMALSYIIQELGTLKDAGLAAHFKQTYQKKATKGTTASMEKQLLAKANTLMANFMKAKVLDNLLKTD